MLLIDRTFVPREWGGGAGKLHTHPSPQTHLLTGRGSNQNMTFPQPLAWACARKVAGLQARAAQEMAWASRVHWVLLSVCLDSWSQCCSSDLDNFILFSCIYLAFSNPTWLYGLDALENSSLRVLIRPNQEKHKENQKLKLAGTTPPPTPTTLMLLN